MARNANRHSLDRLASSWARLLPLALLLGLSACGVQEERGPLLPGSRGGLVRILDDDEEGLLDIESFRGQILLLDFWAPWSKPSLVSLPALRSMQEDFADRSFAVIGMTMVQQVTPQLKEELAALDLPYPVVVADEQIHRRMGAGRAIPSRVLVGRDGAVLRVYPGWVDLDRLRDDVERALEGEPLPPAPNP